MNDHQTNAAAPATAKEYACLNQSNCTLAGVVAPFDVVYIKGQPFCGECKEPLVEGQRNAEVNELLSRNGLNNIPAVPSTEQQQPTEEPQLPPDSPRLITSTQITMIDAFASQIDIGVECKKAYGKTVLELTFDEAKNFLRYVQSIAPRPIEFEPIGHGRRAVAEAHQNDQPSAVADEMSEHRKLASEKYAEAEVNTEAAAKSVHQDLAPEFGKVLTKYEPGALAYGFPPAVGALIEKAKLTPEQTDHLLSNFRHLFGQLDEWRQKVQAIVIRDENDTEAINAAKEICKAMSSERLNAGKKKNIIAEPYLRPKQLIDGVFKIYLDEEQSIERVAIEKAKTKERAEQARKEKIRDDRAAKLSTYVDNVRAFDLLNMSDEAFEILLKGQIEAYEARIAEAKRQDEERQRRLDEEAAERVKLRRQTERRTQLSELGFTRDAPGLRYVLEDLSVFDNEIEFEQDITWTKRIEELKPKAEAARVEAERRRREGDAALKAQQEKERAERDEEFRKKREAESVALAPDKVKLERLADAIAAIELFETSNEKVIDILSGVKADLYNAETKLRRQIDQLP